MFLSDLLQLTICISEKTWKCSEKDSIFVVTPHTVVLNQVNVYDLFWQYELYIECISELPIFGITDFSALFA